MNPITNKKTISEILFDQLGVKAMNIELQVKCSLFCERIDSGEGVTHFVPISESREGIFPNI